MQVKQGKGALRLFLKMPLRTTISMTSSRLELYFDMVSNRFVFETKSRSPPLSPSYPTQMTDYLKQGSFITV